MSEHPNNIKDVLDIAAVFSTLGAFLEMISPVFGLIGAIVGVMRIVEMVTGKSFAEVFKRGSDASNKR